MKHIKKISFSLALALITLNCSDKIDDIVPEDDLSADVIFKIEHLNQLNRLLLAVQ